jgi:hypothetical protein
MNARFPRKPAPSRRSHRSGGLAQEPRRHRGGAWRRHAGRASGGLAEVKRVNAEGRERARAMLFDDGGGTLCARRICHLQDVITEALYDYASIHVYRVENPPNPNE